MRERRGRWWRRDVRVDLDLLLEEAEDVEPPRRHGPHVEEHGPLFGSATVAVISTVTALDRTGAHLLLVPDAVEFEDVAEGLDRAVPDRGRDETVQAVLLQGAAGAGEQLEDGDGVVSQDRVDQGPIDQPPRHYPIPGHAEEEVNVPIVKAVEEEVARAQVPALQVDCVLGLGRRRADFRAAWRETLFHRPPRTPRLFVVEAGGDGKGAEGDGIEEDVDEAARIRHQLFVPKTGR